MVLANMGLGYFLNIEDVALVATLEKPSTRIKDLIKETEARNPLAVVNMTHGRKQKAVIFMKDGRVYIVNRKATSVLKSFYNAYFNHLDGMNRGVSYMPIERSFYQTMLKMTLDVYADIKDELRDQQKAAVNKMMRQQDHYATKSKTLRDTSEQDLVDENLSMEELVTKIKNRLDVKLYETMAERGVFDREIEEDDEDEELEPDDSDSAGDDFDDDDSDDDDSTDEQED